jgi:putative lipase involved disintegration of autophagic bodies
MGHLLALTGAWQQVDEAWNRPFPHEFGHKGGHSSVPFTDQLRTLRVSAKYYLYGQQRMEVPSP